MAKRNYYCVLGVARDASAEQLKQAYRTLAKKYHPDRNPEDETAEAKLREVNEAYTCLKDVHKRAAYDREQAGMIGAGASNAQPDLDGAELLDILLVAIRRHVALPPESVIAAVLWCVHTHCFRAFEITPRLQLTSPGPDCGKTTLFRVLKELVDMPTLVEGISPAAIYRIADQERVTFLIDEADTFVPGNRALQEVIDSGYSRHGCIVRIVAGLPKSFQTFAPVALATLTRLASTIESRSIRLHLERASPTEAALLEPVRRYRGELIALRELIARWVLENRASLEAAEPAMPPNFRNRRADRWFALLGIADVAGGDWPQKARQAAVALEAQQDLLEGERIRLLADIRFIFENSSSVYKHKLHGAIMLSEELCRGLSEIIEAPWGSWKHGRPITPQHLAEELKHFMVNGEKLHSVQIWRRGKVRHYFRLTDLEPLFERYLAKPARSPSS